MNKKHTHKAFTLIEIIFYLAIFGVIVGSLSSIGVYVATDNQATYIRNQMVSEAGLVFNDVIREFRAGSTFDPLNSTFNQNYSEIQFTNDSSQTITYQVDQARSVLQKKTNGGTFTDTHSTDLNVDQFLIEALNPSNSLQLFKVTMTFSNDFNQTYTLSSSTNFLP